MAARRSDAAARRCRALIAAAAASLVLTLAPQSGRAQGPDPLDPTSQPTAPKTLPIEKQSPTNPYPRGGGDNQNRSRGGSDVYWGVTNGNVPWYLSPLARVPGDLRDTTGLGGDIPLLELDGWQYPRMSRNGVFQNVGTRFAYASPLGRVTATPQVWQEQQELADGTTSTNVKSPNGNSPGTYFKARAVSRPTAPAQNYPAALRFTWSLQDPAAGGSASIPGPANQQRRYRIFVQIPEPAVNPTPDPEDRITDARYTVYYYVQTGSNPADPTSYEPRQLTCVISQVGGGVSVLRHADGTDAFFPLFTSATFGAGGIGSSLAAQPPLIDPARYGTLPNPPGLQQGVALDNTTEDSGSSFYFVIADALQLEPGLDRLVATPTTTPQHGGTKHAEFETAQRLAVTANAPLVPPAAGVKKNQRRPYLPSLTEADSTSLPSGTSPTSANPVSPYADAANRPVGGEPFNTPNTAQPFYTNAADIPSFINDARDPLYNRNDPRFYTDYDTPVNGANLETWNPSTLFEGPESLIDPRLQFNPSVPASDEPGSNNELSINNVFAYLDPATYPFGRQVGPGIPNRPRVEIFDPATGQRYTDPQDAGQERAATSADANNFQAYGRTRRLDARGGTPVLQGVYTKLFSQMQVVVARCEYAVDPEANLPASERLGTRTIQLGAVYSYDWLTGKPVWRFPDRTYLPQGTLNPNRTPVTAYTGGPEIAGLRNKLVGTDTAVPNVRVPVYEVPGIVYADRNGNGVIDEDEVFIGNDGAFDRTGAALPGVPVSRDDLPGGIFASVTIAPRVLVQGVVDVPTYEVYDSTTGVPLRGVNGVAPAPEGRYYTQSGTTSTGTRAGFNPVPVGMAFIAAGNGVLYGIDAYGNNDSRYEEFRDATGVTDTYREGTYHPGTTNTLWTFSATQHQQILTTENTNVKYYQRLQREIPATGSFGASAPVLAYKYNDSQLVEGTPPTVPAPGQPFFSRYDPQNPNASAELRLFVGNTNGVIYALDAAARAGATVDNMGNVTGVNRLPIRKGVQVSDSSSYTGGNIVYDAYRGDLKWWFRTRGAINHSPAVSVMQQNSGQGATYDVAQKGVFVASNEGRVYSFDWDGPVARQPIEHTTYLNFTGASSNDFALAAQKLNDDWFFHNSQPVNGPFADTTEGNVRPRWTFPQLYRDLGVSATLLRSDQPFPRDRDRAQANGTFSHDAAGSYMADPEALGAITSPPVLMDFYWKDPSDGASIPELRSYVAIVANDPTATGSLATQSRVYLLDQVGDRVNLLSYSRRRDPATGPGPLSRAVSMPRDRFSPRRLLSVAEDPTLPTGLTWTYRYQYDNYPAVDSPQTVDQVRERNNPNSQFFSSIATPAPTATQLESSLRGDARANIGQPGRRMLPTLFAGGAGEVYALDIDPETGLFMRWRSTLQDLRLVMPINPDIFLARGAAEETNKTVYPEGPLGAEAVQDRLFPIDLVFTSGASASRPLLADRRILARRVDLVSDSGLVTGLALSGGPMQNRNNRNRQNLNAQQAGPYPAGLTSPGPFAPPAPLVPTVPQGIYPNATNDGIVYLPVPTNDVPNLRPFDLDPLNPGNYDLNGLLNNLIPFGHVTNLVNQDIDDALTTTRGHIASEPGRLGPVPGRADNLGSEPFVQDTAFQFPTLFVTTVNGNLHSLSSAIDGEDYLNNDLFPTINLPGGGTRQRNPNSLSTPTGWGFASPGNPVRYNTGHVHQFIRFGPGGPAGVAVISNAFYPALDPRSVTFGPGEPNQADPAPPRRSATETAATNPNAVPHPDFRPRQIGFGVPAGTANFPAAGIATDWHTGQTGFPLDPNGLGFDKRWANANGASPQNPNAAGAAPALLQEANGDYHIRMVRTPGYSGIGEAIPDATPGKTPNNQLPDGVRYNASANLNDYIAVNGTNVNIDDLLSDDVNPAAQNLTWIYAGSESGVLYAYTPAVFGQGTGFAGGVAIIPPFNFNDDGNLGTQPKVDIFTRDEFRRLRDETNARTNRPDERLTVAAQSKQNLYEWGESVYIVVYDIFLQGTPVPGTDALGRIRRRSRLFVTDERQIRARITIASRDGGGTMNRQVDVPLKLVGGSAVRYSYTGPVSGTGGSGIDAGYAVYEYRLDGPQDNNPQTPGSLLEVSIAITGNSLQRAGQVVQQGSLPPGVGTDAAAQQANSSGARFAIANPLAVQGFLVGTNPDASGALPPVGVPRTGADDVPNSIGPYFTGAAQNGPAKSRILLNSASAVPGTEDPDKAAVAYYQALTNGNRVRRRDLRIYIGDGADRQVNANYGNPIQSSGTNVGDEPEFYFPVATSPGYVNHGSSGSTAMGGGQQSFRLLNRSLARRIPNLRALPEDQPGDLLFRAWPAAIMNGPAVERPIAGASDNRRNNPPNMHPLGVINPLPWEQLPAEARPWNTSVLVNNSLDYPDIASRRVGALRITVPGGEITSSPAPLEAIVNRVQDTTGTGSVPVANSSIINLRQPNSATGLSPLLDPRTPFPARETATVTVKVPPYQPANLSAAHVLTSTYEAPSQLDLTGSGVDLDLPTVQGPLQLPREARNRVLREYVGTEANGATSLTPFGYTSRVVAFVDYNNTNRLGSLPSQLRTTGVNPAQTGVTSGNFSGKAFREFEVWAGVPVDQSLKIAESTIDLGAVPHGFAIQNGQMGYRPAATDVYRYGFLPNPLFDLSTFGGVGAPYGQYFKKFTVQSNSNVNLYNLRASQRIESSNSNRLGSGSDFYYLALRSDLVDPRFGILAVGADPRVAGPSPQVVSSLDRQYDATWDQYIQTQFIDPTFGNAMTTADPTGLSPYEKYYQQLGGFHTLHKARVGATTPSVLSVPDVPSATNLRALPVDNAGTVITNGLDAALNNTLRQNVAATQVAAAVPLGTPIGVYQSSNSPFTVFEDHDTLTPYAGTPRLGRGGTPLTPEITAAGPLYGGRNDSHPGNPAVGTSGVPARVPFSTYGIPAGSRPIQSAGAGVGQGVWRVRRFVADPTQQNGFRVEYLPATSPSLMLKLTVTESALTGQAPDRALDPAGIFSGSLPGIDPVPLFTTDPNIGNRLRPASALSPAAWRDAAGNIHVYFARNEIALPGAPYQLFSSSLRWDTASGAFMAERPGAPLNEAAVNSMRQAYEGRDAAGNEGSWFTPPVAIAVPGVAGTTSATSPYVLVHYPQNDTSLNRQYNTDAATLYFLASTPTPGGRPYSQIYYTSIDPQTGAIVPNSAAPFLENYDPTLARFGPRAVFSDDLSRVYLFYFGGTPGRYGLYYSTRQGSRGIPTDRAPDASIRNREVQLSIPATFTSASDPAPVIRRMNLVEAGVARNRGVVDLYYTAISRTTQAPEIYMTRYVIGLFNADGTLRVVDPDNPDSAPRDPQRLTPVALPRIIGERINARGREGLYQAHHISWFRDLPTSATDPRLARLPQVRILRNGGAVTQAGQPANWRFDNSTGVLYQAFTEGGPNTLTYVYVDASAGTVRFRGPRAPRLDEPVLVDYEPQTYRVTSGGGINQAPFAFTDDRNLPAQNPANEYNAVIKRPTNINAGRNWLFWQKGASGSRPGTIFFKARRVGIDLKDAGFLANALGANDSVALTPRPNAAPYNQTPLVQLTSISNGATLGNVAYEVDYVHGRIYVDPAYEGLRLGVRYTRASNGQVVDIEGTLTQIDELTTGAARDPGVEAPLFNRINEGQPYAFLDTYAPTTGITRPDPAPGLDPTLTPGRLWFFWTSPQTRKGAMVGPNSRVSDREFPNAYNLFWATMAPNFDAPSYAPSTRQSTAPTTTAP
jgi:hypothetical protein